MDSTLSYMELPEQEMPPLHPPPKGIIYMHDKKLGGVDPFSQRLSSKPDLAKSVFAGPHRSSH
jgi:hypothetical protein